MGGVAGHDFDASGRRNRRPEWHAGGDAVEQDVQAGGRATVLVGVNRVEPLPCLVDTPLHLVDDLAGCVTLHPGGDSVVKDLHLQGYTWTGNWGSGGDSCTTTVDANLVMTDDCPLPPTAYAVWQLTKTG